MVICDSNYAAMFNSYVASKMLSSKRQIFSVLKAGYEMYKPVVVKRCYPVHVNGKIPVSSTEYWVRLTLWARREK